ncbi:unnamed protein product (macronuclear) [Paramecium tetraurelia]|uniref:Uncharacterized protein n=1 Tax=Paramecium tetraurelia TaxID=5888 RepID=A0DFR3_PARTE|nr:uncharacterized protein GSPATT00016693001 [Paramecium tetraurelia]CAK81880.1 unnamed protein product [Paramecium tetraurelia]|eukprot:XP_001449277.1 hypothetical protein (macronuclear) [Paramecium tetraurelia strain d4-2]
MRIQEGAIETFYYYLWLQNDSIKQNKVEFHLPDTLIYRLGVIQAWYFTHNNEILVKKLENRTLPNIETAFLKDCENDVCAYFISCKPRRDFYNTQETRGEFLQDQLNIDCRTSILYLNQQQFKTFIHNPNIHRNGILQKFTKPALPKENVIQAIWSQNLLLLSQRVNNIELTSNKFDVQEKCSTFNSPESYSKAYPVKSKVITTQIRRLINYITTRICVVTYEKFRVNRAVLYCKLDYLQRINILYCTSLRSNDECPYPIQFGQLLRPENVKNTITTNKQKPIKLIMDVQCLSCQQFCQTEDLHPIKYKLLITQGEHYRMDIKPYSTGVKRADHQQTEDNPENYIANTTKLIPDIIKKLFPSMSYTEFAEMKENSAFLNKELLVCFNCYLKFTQCRLRKTQTSRQLQVKQKNRSITDLIRQASQEISQRNTERDHSGNKEYQKMSVCLTQRGPLVKTAEAMTMRSTMKSSRTSSIMKNNITLRTTGRKSSV